MNGCPTCILALAIVSLTGFAPAQERQRDTAVAGHIQLTEPGMDSGGATFSIPQHLSPPSLFSSPTFFFEGVPTMAGTGFTRSGFEAKQDLLAPLRAQWAREADMRTFRTIMGTLQLGGVAFLAARQLTGAGIMTARPRPVRPRNR